MVITAAASGAAQEQALQMAARQGRISFFGGLPKDNPVIACDSNLVHYRELTIVGRQRVQPRAQRAALELIASGAVPVADLITHRLPLYRALEAIDIVARGAGDQGHHRTVDEEESAVPERTVTIGSRSGLHARPAALFVKAAGGPAGGGAPSAVGDGQPVPAPSMLVVLSLGAGHGTEVTLERRGRRRPTPRWTRSSPCSPATWTPKPPSTGCGLHGHRGQPGPGGGPLSRWRHRPPGPAAAPSAVRRGRLGPRGRRR